MKITTRLATAAIVTVAAVALAGCSGSGGTNTETGGEPSGTLTGIFFSGYKDTYEKIVTAFEKKYPNVDVKFDYQGGDIGGLVMTQLQGGQAPDILTSFPGGQPGDTGDTTVSLAAAGRIAKLDASWAPDVPEAWQPSVNYEDGTYAYPGALQPLAAVYNQTKLDELGLTIPTTLDELFQLCTDAKAKGIYALSQGLGDPAGPQMLTFAQMATLQPDPASFEADLAAGEASYADSEWVDAFKIYKKMNDLGCFGEGALGRTRDQGIQEVATGAALGLVDVGAALAGIQTANADNDYVIASVPATNNADDTRIVALPGFVTTINAKAKNPTAAQAFLEFMGQPDQAIVYANGFASVPLIPNADYEAPAELVAFSDLIGSGSYAPLVAVQPEVQTTLNQSVQSLILGDVSPEQLAQKLDSVYKK